MYGVFLVLHARLGVENQQCGVVFHFSWHHVTGSPTGTGSNTPCRMSWSRPALTSSFQWIGTGTVCGEREAQHRDPPLTALVVYPSVATVGDHMY